MDVSRAQLSNSGNSVQLVDPEFPWTVDVYTAQESESPHVRGLVIWARGDEPITSAVLSRLPLRQLASVAASALQGEDEAQYRMLAVPRQPGQRSWPPAHFYRVSQVAAWARRVGRSGGAGGTVSEFWQVDYRTARRWLSRARELGLAADQP